MSNYTGTKAVTGNSTIVSIGPINGTASPSYTPILEIKSSSNTGEKWDTESAMNFNSGIIKEKMKTALDPGQIELMGNDIRTDAGQVLLKAAFLDPQNSYMFKVQYALAPGQVTSGDVETFAALVTAFKPVNEVGKQRTLAVTLELNANTVFTAGS